MKKSTTNKLQLKRKDWGLRIFLISYLLSHFSLLSFGQTFINENFNAGIPSNWTVTTTGCTGSGVAIKWVGTTNGWQGLANSLDNTEFAIVNSEPGTFCNANEFLTSPVFDATSSTTLLLEFDHFFNHYIGDVASAEVFDGASWITVASFTSNTGWWLTPDKQSIDIAPYKNATMQIRFHYQANWDYWWAVDNILVAATSPTAVNETSSSDGMEVYPNPTTGKANMQMSGLANVQMSIYNMYGECIYQQISTSSHQQIDLSSQPDGIYFITVKSENGTTTQKLIIQK